MRSALALGWAVLAAAYACGGKSVSDDDETARGGADRGGSSGSKSSSGDKSSAGKSSGGSGGEGPADSGGAGGEPQQDTCGDGVYGSTEQCDDGNTEDGDGCDADCYLEPTIEPFGECGNGVVEAAEECDDGNTDSGDGCESGCTLDPLFHPSCAQGNLACQGEVGDCCTTLHVTGGETLLIGEPGSEVQATVSDFHLDKYEVTVARFREFVLKYDDWRAQGEPSAGAGAHPMIDGSGWDESWLLPSDAAAVKALVGSALSCTWSETPGGNDDLPMSCLHWYLAFAFCIWDGGRLPTEVEWEYAASGGGENRTYPWGEQVPDPSLAVYCGGCQESDVSILLVGSKPAGAGRFGHLDLAGSMEEWTLDWHAAFPSEPGLDYANVESGEYRVARGGNWWLDAQFLTTDVRLPALPTSAQMTGGVRCAR